VPRFRWAGVGLALCCAAASAQVEELFSRHVRVFKPQGEFAPRLIKLSPASGDGWREVKSAEQGFRMFVPAAAQIDATPAESRVLEVVLSDSPARPRPLLRIDVFTPRKDDPARIDAEYVESYTEQYPEEAFGGKFKVTDSGLILLRGSSLAMIGGTYEKGAVGAYRHQWSYLSKKQQLFITFDCAEQEWERYADTIGSMLLSLKLSR
jgi:hypothetical protein